MGSNAEVSRLRKRLENALRENRRFREQIELLASQNHHLRERVREAGESPPEVTAFEDIKSAIRPGDRPPPEPKYSGSRTRLNWYSETWFPVFEKGIAPLDPSPGMRCLTAVRAPIRMGFQLFGLDSGRIEEAVSKVEERQLRERDFIPVFVTDNSSLPTTAISVYFEPGDTCASTSHRRSPPHLQIKGPKDEF
jgi:hypothetical protein